MPSPKKTKNTKPRYDKRKFLAAFILTIIVFAAVRHFAGIRVPMLGIDADKPSDPFNDDVIAEVYVGNYEEEIEYSSLDTVILSQEEIDARDAQEVDSARHANELLDSQDYADATPMPEPEDEATSHEDEINAEEPSEPAPPAVVQASSDGRRKPHRIRGVPSWDSCFPDINDLQLTAARKNGIRPAKDRETVMRLVRERRLVNITNSPYYTVDDLTHSMPYLVPKAQQLLNTICCNFIDSLQMKGLPVHLPMVTSVFRTTDDVLKLQKGNVNATTHSCHCYGTTVDITYNRFLPVTGDYNPDVPLLRWNFQMKQVLAEVLDDLRRQGKCYVKYERKQACFHLTVR